MSRGGAAMLVIVGLCTCSQQQHDAPSVDASSASDIPVATDQAEGAPDGSTNTPSDTGAPLDSCAPAQTLSCAEALALTINVAPGQGAGPSARCGVGEPGVVYRLSSPTAARVELLVEASDGAPEIAAVAADCDDGVQCDASVDGRLVLTLGPAETRDLIVSPGGATAITLSLSCCVPSCEGRSCGDDGCGGTCGGCGQGTVCDNAAGACTSAQCVPAAPLGCGDSVTGVASDGPGHTQTVPGNGCNAFDYSGPEMAYLFESQFTGSLVARLPQYDASEDLDVFILEDGGDGLCDASRCLASGLSMASAPVQSGKRYYVLVDGFEGNVSPFDLSLECCTPSCQGKSCGDDGCGGSCGVCDQGVFCDPETSQCLNPTCAPAATLACGTQLTDVALDGPGSTDVLFTTGCAPGQDYSGPERVYRFEPAVDASVTFSMPAYDAEEDLDLFLLGDADGQCLLSECLTFGFQGITTDVKGGQTYYLVVDGYKGNVSKFNLKVTCCTASCEGKVCGSDGCGGSCGGCGAGQVCTFDGGACVTAGYVGNDTCATALVVDALPFEAQVNTQEANDDYTMGGKKGCVDQYEGAPDAVFAWTATSTGTLVVSVVPALDTDESCSPVATNPTCSPKVAYVSAGCPDAANECLDAVDLYQAPKKTLVVKNLVPGTTYYVVVDGFDSTEAGVASLQMTFQP